MKVECWKGPGPKYEPTKKITSVDTKGAIETGLHALVLLRTLSLRTSRLRFGKK